MSTAREKARLHSLLKALPPPDYTAAVSAFLQLAQLERADTVMLFAGVGSEPDTAPIFHALRARGKRLVYPLCLPGHQLEARQVMGLDELVPGKWNIPEPGPGCPPVARGEIGLALVPCLACDRLGFRLGHGGGYYDRFLAGFSGLSVCLCPPDRMQSTLPADPWDVPVQLVLTG